ncbi:MAG: hypothetical protein KJO21_02385 [Verrucomicrobiae bacterium]|nr:hypothetical protein [Verrucomicrobiae bacterium]NNJ44148.1 hypothetical protein [Akkermansiaceae bacterium]
MQRNGGIRHTPIDKGKNIGNGVVWDVWQRKSHNIIPSFNGRARAHASLAQYNLNDPTPEPIFCLIQTSVGQILGKSICNHANPTLGVQFRNQNA